MFMQSYNFRINRPKLGDNFFKKLHLGQHLEDVYPSPMKRGPPKTRWLQGIAPHQFIFRVTSDRAKGEKRVRKISLSNNAVVSALENIGISKKWVDCSTLIQLLNLDTSFVKGDYITKATRLQFKLVEKICHYFDDENKARKTGVAHFLSF